MRIQRKEKTEITSRFSFFIEAMELTTISSGSGGNCSLITADGTAVLVDAGISLRRITCSLRALGTELGDVSAVLITHEHIDHIKALGMLTRYWRIPIFATPGTADAIRAAIPEAAGMLWEFSPGEVMRFGTLEVQAFPTSHDAAQSVGYVFTHEGRRLLFATDTGVITPEEAEAGKGCDAALLESNHDVEMLRRGPYPAALKRRILSERGHLSNGDCGSFAAYLAGLGTRRFILAHLSRENNTPALAVETVSRALAAAGAVPGRDVSLCTAPEKTPMGPIEV